MGHFCPPWSGSGFRIRIWIWIRTWIRIRIHWPDWIRIRSESKALEEKILIDKDQNVTGPETLLSQVPVLAGPDRACASASPSSGVPHTARIDWAPTPPQLRSQSIIMLVCWCRSQFLPALIEHVRLPLLSQEFLIQRVETEPLLRLNSACKAVFPFTSLQNVNLFDPGFVSVFGTAFKWSECGRKPPALSGISVIH